MRNNYTPGPWVSLNHCNNEVSVFGQENRIAVVQDMSLTSDNTAANTALIVAAPEMFELLKTIWVNIPSTVWEKYGLSEEEIISVMVKAKGE